MLRVLFNTEFTWSIPRDENRAEDGRALRARFMDENDIPYKADSFEMLPSCTVLEMMVGLSLRMEETIMSNPVYGNRTGLWFWTMISNLGLNSQHEENFDEDYVHKRLDIFMSRAYASDGSKGALFIVKNPRKNMRRVDIWYQMSWYLDTIED